MTYRKYSQPSNRAYAIFDVKASSRDDGTIVGIASTPELDRVGDVLIPTGAKYQLPIPLLWQHKHDKPIGHVTQAKITSRGIEVVGKIAVGATDEIDNVYKLVRAGLVQGLSVGFRALEQPEVTRTGLLYKSWELMELSVVTLPCNTGATITAVKSACGVASVLNDVIPLVSAHSGSVPLRSGSISLLSRRGDGSIPLRSRGDGSIKLRTGSIRLIGRR